MTREDAIYEIKQLAVLSTKRNIDRITEALEMAIEALRKTENSSEIPNNCEDEPQYEMGMGTLKCDNCSEYGSFKCTKCDGEMYFKRLEPKDKPTISKMEQVEDEQQTETKTETQNSNLTFEKQTDCPWK